MIFSPLRIFFDAFDTTCLTAEERELQGNCLRLRAFVQKMVDKRREDIANHIDKHDFLTLMVTDDLFKDKDEYILDECLTIMLASTLTNTLMITNSIYYLTKCQDKLAKLRRELLT